MTSQHARGPHRDAIADALREQILSGALSSGDRIREELVAREFGVSRVPVREALNRLEAEGFITLTPFKGASVSENSGRDVLDYMQVRRGLEVLAAQLAAEAKGGEVAGDLSAIAREGELAASQEQCHEDLPGISLEFHRLVHRASANRHLERMLEGLLSRISWGFTLDPNYSVVGAWRDHSAIAAAILDGSPVQAGHLMNEHVAKDEHRYRKQYELSRRTRSPEPGENA
ncbi:GntR family transcriptional regulator [Glycomyces sp. NPDC048151]|uniref:GntR family transcriptional regulator n=1 Tax=Glycomyces sp. NPDC048151 TaxID=3364002 RepID=UPI0037105AA7